MIVVDVVAKIPLFNILLLILLSSCFTSPTHREYNKQIKTKDVVIITRVYNHSIGIKPPKNSATSILHSILNFITTKHLRNTTLEIGSEIILGYEGCSEKNEKYIIGSKLVNPLKNTNNPAKYYQYKPEYDAVYIKAGRYKLCSLRHYDFTEYNQEYEFKEFDVEQINSWHIFRSKDVIYLGDIYINKKKYKANMKITEVRKFLKYNYPELLDRLKYTHL